MVQLLYYVFYDLADMEGFSAGYNSITENNER